MNTAIFLLLSLIGAPLELKQLGRFERAVMNREYREAQAIADRIDRRHSPLQFSRLARILIAEAESLERMDLNPSEVLERELSAILSFDKKSPPPLPESLRSWDSLIEGGILGLRGMHAYRNEEWVSALDFGWKGIEALNRALALDPTMIDAELGLGVYAAWRGSIQRRLRMGWFFGDTQAEGIAQIEKVKTQGRFTRWAARMALGLLHLDDKNRAALGAVVDEIRSEFPNHLLADLLMVVSYLETKEYAEALRHLDGMLKRDPKNAKATYLKTIILIRMKTPRPQSELYLTEVIRVTPIRFYRAQAHYFLGELTRAASPTKAIDHYRTALTLEPSMTQAADALRELERAGKP